MSEVSIFRLLVAKAPVMTRRFSAAGRTLRLAQKYRITRLISEPVELKKGIGSGSALGWIDRVEVSAGAMRVVGWTVRPDIEIETELQIIQVDANINRADLKNIDKAYGFDAKVNGTDFLTIRVGADRLLSLKISHPRHKFAALLRTYWLILTIFFQTRGDIFNWFVSGDSEAGSNLERLLVPTPASSTRPTAQTNFFTEGGGVSEECIRSFDIILPVYNAYDDLCMCLSRLERFTASTHHLIIVDDASTDQRVQSLILEFMTKRSNVKLIENKSNLGFVGSINLGLSISKNDVVLLNSDALVAEGWLERLLAPICAYADIASVTPMTNNGEIASVPVICKAGPLPEGALDRINSVAMSLDPLAAISYAPTGVGFCMAISRSWLERVPKFDVAFGKGYGEEVDWCQRVAALGARHVLTGAVFVEHRGGMSFGSEKAQRILVNNRLIDKRYPTYDADVAAFIEADPAVGQRLALGLAAADWQISGVPIYLAHRLGGGAEHWLADEIATHLSVGKSVAVLRDGDVPDSVIFELHTTNGVTTGQVLLDDVPLYLAGLSRLRLVYSNLVAARSPLKLLTAVVSALRETDRFTIVFHDFLPLCPSYNLIGTDGQFCDLPNAASCQRCYAALATTSGQRPATIENWRDSWRRFLDRATEIVVFSEDSRRQVARVWPDLIRRIEVRPHRPHHLPARIVAPATKRLTIGVLGGIGYSKGAKVLHDLASCMASDVDIVVIGKIDSEYTHPRIKVHGAYDRIEIASLAASYRVDCWLIPSIWPETFCYAAHEALATGLPVFVYDLGAQAEAAAAARNGYLLQTGCQGAELERHILKHVLQFEGTT